MSPLRLVSFALVLAAACATDSTDDQPESGSGSGSGGAGSGSGTGSGSGSGTGTTAYVPVEGAWHYVDHDVTTTNCPDIVDAGQIAGNFGITDATSAGFHVIPNDGTNEFDCTLAGATFDCPSRAAFEEIIGSTTLVASVTAEGAFSSSTRGSGTQNGTVVCTGAGCAALGLATCTFIATFLIEAE